MKVDEVNDISSIVESITKKEDGNNDSEKDSMVNGGKIKTKGNAYA